MRCKSNGRTFVNFLTPAPGGTETSASYVLGLSHYTCGNKKMCVNSAEGFPIASNLDVQVIGGPQPLGNGEYCCDVRCICDVTYRKVCGCGCGCQNDCPETEKVVATVCVPCGETAPTATANGVVAQAVNVNCGCSTTNEMDVTVSFTLETAAAANSKAK